MLYQFQNNKPKKGEKVYVAPGAQIIGDVNLNDRSSVWYNAVIRGDIDQIIIGEESNIQENCALHVDEGIPLTVGKRVTVGHGAVLHGCKIKNDCIIGMGATILNGAEIGEGSIIGAGALIPENKKIPSGSMVLGMPGKVVKELDENALQKIKESARHYHQLALEHKNKLKELN